jgi:hypothetical protein
MQHLRQTLVTFAAVGAAAVGGAAIANAASSGASATPSPSPAAGGYARQGGHAVNGKTESPLTGDTAAKVEKAALAKVDGTVARVETNVDGSAPYEAHIRKSDGTEVEVQVSKDFTVAAVNSMPGHP